MVQSNTLKNLRSNFTQVANQALNDKRLSWKARGIFAFLQSKPEEWNFFFENISKQSDKDGDKSLRSGLKELEELGYLTRKPKYNKQGIYGYDWILSLPVVDHLVQVPKVHAPNVHEPNDTHSNTYLSNTNSNKYIKKSNSDSNQQSKLNSTKDIKKSEDINSTKKISEDKKNKKREAKEILNYLNKVADKHFRDINSNITLLTTLLNFYKSEEIERVIDFKIKVWRNTEMSKYLRPSTLFRSSNFDRYVNELPKEKVAPKEKVQPQTKETGFGSELGFLGEEND